MSKHTEVLSHWQTMVEDFSTSSLGFYSLVREGIARREIPDLTLSEVEWKESGLGSGKRLYLRVAREGLNLDICAAPCGTGFFFSWWLASIPKQLLDFVVLFGFACLGGFCLFMTFVLAYLDIFLASRGTAFGGLGFTPMWLVFAPFIFFGVPLGLGFLVRIGKLDGESAVLAMPITGVAYRFLFRPTTYFSEDTSGMIQDMVHRAVLEAVDQVTSAQGIRALSEEARKVTFSRRG